MPISEKDFKKISIRGRVAFGICCLENAMEKYKVSGEGWNILLERLWSFTSLPAIFVPVDSGGVEFVLERWAEITDFMPFSKYFQEAYSYADLCKYLTLYNRKIIDENEYNLLREAYGNTNDRITSICSFVVDIGMCELWSTPDGRSAITLERLHKLIDFMHKNNISLPDMEPFRQYEYSPEGTDDDAHGWGVVFDGKRYSKFLK